MTVASHNGHLGSGVSADNDSQGLRMAGFGTGEQGVKSYTVTQVLRNHVEFQGWNSQMCGVKLRNTG